MDFPVRLAGTTQPDIVLTRSDFGSVSVRAGGVKIKRGTGKGISFPIPLADGSTQDLVVDGVWTGLRVRFRDQTIQLERRLAPWELTLTLLPLVLVAGGAVGGAIGAAGWALSTQAVRRIESPLGRALVPMGIAIGAVVAYVLVSEPLARLIRTLLR